MGPNTDLIEAGTLVCMHLLAERSTFTMERMEGQEILMPDVKTVNLDLLRQYPF